MYVVKFFIYGTAGVRACLGKGEGCRLGGELPRSFLVWCRVARAWLECRGGLDVVDHQPVVLPWHGHVHASDRHRPLLGDVLLRIE